MNDRKRRGPARERTVNGLPLVRSDERGRVAIRETRRNAFYSVEIDRDGVITLRPCTIHDATTGEQLT